MEVFAVGFKIMVASAAAAAVMVGAVGGAMVWRGGRSLLLGGLATVAAYSLIAPSLVGLSFLKVAVFHGLPPLILGFLVAYLTARHLRSRAGVGRLWATLAGIGCGLAVGVLNLLLFRISFWAPMWVALGADACLTLVTIRNRRLVPP